jgi:hypothetical protein
MAPKEYNPKRSPEWQRRAIERHLTKFILDPQGLPGTDNTFYELIPEEATTERALYDKAEGDSVLYALYYSRYKAGERLQALQAEAEREGLNPAAETELGLVELELQEIEGLIEAYIDPEHKEFLTVDLLDERGEP